MYFPHVDNVYSHRSTQRYKRKPFVSHYWDCRLKGRPSGTPKSEDPTKKKRKRVARERDLCDVKIKITEYFPETTATDITHHQKSVADSFLPGDSHHGANAPATNSVFPNGSDAAPGGSQPFGMLTANPALSENPSAVAGTGQKWYTIQRVNGNGGNGKTDGVAGGHRHTLEDSDRVKKNSVQRYLLKKSKDEKKVVVVSLHFLVYLMCLEDASGRESSTFVVDNIRFPLVHGRNARGVHAYVTYPTLLPHAPVLLSFATTPLSRIRE